METRKLKSNQIVTIDRLSPFVTRYGVRGAESFEFDIRKLHVDIVGVIDPMRGVPIATWHGIDQKLSNRTACDSGTPASVKYERMHSLATHLLTGTESWNMARGTGQATLRTSDRSVMLEAATRLGKKLREPEKLTVDQIRAILIRPDFKPTVDAIRAELAAGIDTESLFDELDGE
jgi:hypothetical protein